MAGRRLTPSEIAELRSLLNRYPTDIDQLEYIAGRLKDDNHEAVRDLFVDVWGALQSARRTLKLSGATHQPSKPAVIPPDFKVLSDILSEAGLASPDRRPLHRYRVSDQTYDKLRALVTRLSLRQELAVGSDLTSAAFVITCAEWFRREYDGGAYAWRSPAPEIIDSLTHAERTRLATSGLRWWGRPVKKTAHGELRLQSIVLEGGFPVKLLETRANSHISIHLRTLIARLEAQRSVELEDAAAYSVQTGARLNAFDHEEFHYLCAELCLAILARRREGAAHVPAGLPVSAWLDANHPGWREELPIVLTDAGGDKLLDDLINTSLTDVSGDATCLRILRKSDQGWTPGVSIGLSGPMRPPRGVFSAVDGRLRLFAAGALAHMVSGEIGLLEPPTEDDPDWYCRPRGRDRRQADLPLDQPAVLQVRSVDTVRDFVWPRGDAVRSDVVALSDPRGDDAVGAPDVLHYLGVGSLRTRRARIYVWAPLDYRVEPIQGGTPIPAIWTGSAQLFELTASVRVCPPGGSHFRIELKASDELSERMRFTGDAPTGVTSADPRIELFTGSPELAAESNGRLHTVKAGEVVWKSVGGHPRDWRNAPPNGVVGVMDVTWKDPHSAASRDRRRIAILPKGGQIKTRGTGPASCELELNGFDGWTFSPVTDCRWAGAAGGRKLTVSFDGLPEANCIIDATPSKGAPIRLVVRMRYTGGGFLSADGRRIVSGRRLMLDDLRGAVAFAEGKSLLFAGTGAASRQYRFEDELPLWRISDDIVRIFSGSTDLDYSVKLELGGLAGKPLEIARYAAAIGVDHGAALLSDIATPEDTDAPCALDWISLASATRVPIAEKRWCDWISQPRATLPDSLAGPGILIFREGRKMVARPRVYAGAAPVDEDGLCSLQIASLPADFHDRRAALKQAVSHLGAGDSDAAAGLRYLIDLYRTLDRAPPSTVDVSSALSRDRAAQAALLCACATDEERVQIWRLENELPFLWAMVPVEAWRKSLQVQGQSTVAKFMAAGLAAEAAETYFGPIVTALADSLKRLDPILETPIDLATATPASSPPPGLAAPCSDRIRRIEADRHAVPGRIQSVFREAGSPFTALLPNFQRFDTSQWEGLDAPCVAAMVAAGKAKASDKEIAKICEIQAQEPLSFADIYSAALRLLWTNAPLTC